MTDRAKAGDMVIFLDRFVAGKGYKLGRGIVGRRDGAYLYVVIRKNGATFERELYDDEIQEILSNGNPVPQTDHQRTRAEIKAQQHRALSLRLAEVYYGRPATEEFVFGSCTGGAIFQAMATAAQELLG